MNLIGCIKPTAAVFAGFVTVIGCSAATQSVSHTKIVKGRDADAKLYPVVSLNEGDSASDTSSFCTGVMISPRHLLTAAHCSLGDDGKSTDPASVSVVANESDPESENVELHSVQSIAVHEDYSSENTADESADDVKPGDARDIAIWTLSEPVRDVHTARVLDPNDVLDAFVDGQSVVIMGYGKHSAREPASAHHNLRMAETKFSKRLGAEEDALSASEFFAGGKGLPDTCNGDSGGPAFVKSKNGTLLLVGLTSRGPDSCDRGGIYTLVPAYRGWIKGVLGVATYGSFLK